MHKITSVYLSQAHRERDAKTIFALATSRDSSALQEAHEIIGALESRLAANEALSTLIPHLPLEVIEEALRAVCRSSVDSNSSGPWKTLATIVPRLPANLLSEVLEIAMRMGSN